MKSSIKKFVSLFVCLSLTLSAIPVAYAIDVMYPYESSTETIFLSNNSAANIIPSSVKYNYILQRTSSDINYVDVEMPLLLMYDDQSVATTVTGQLPIYTLDDNTEYTTGALEGTVTINNINFSVTAAFQKFDNDSAVNVALTFFNPTAEIIFKFGTLFVEYEKVKDVLPNSAEPDGIDYPNLAMPRETNTSDYEYVTASTAKLSNVNAIKQSIYRNYNKRRILVMVSPYITNMNRLSTSEIASVDRIRINVTETSDCETYISGMVLGATSSVSNNASIYETGSSAANLLSAISALAYANASPYLTLLASLIDVLSFPTVSIEHGVDSVSAEYRNLGLVDEDWDQIGLSVAFQTAPLVSSTPFNAKYTCTSEIRYNIHEITSSGAVGSYYRTVTTSKTATIPFV